MKKENDESSKNRILKAATKLFAQKGFDGTSIREICKEANANICMISYFWGGKQELYNGIIEDLIEQQTNYAKTFTDINLDTSKLSKKEQIELLFLILDKAIDFLYSKISNDMIIFILREQQKADFKAKSLIFRYLTKLLANIFEKDIKDKEMIYKTVFIMSQINSPRIMSAFTLGELNQTEFRREDILIIKENVKFYVNLLLQEAKIV